MKITPRAFALAAALLAAWAPAHAIDATRLADVEARVAAVEPRLIDWRRDIHAHPELSNQETRTAALVAAHLRRLGLEVTTGVGGTGVVGLLKGARPGKVVALRADMDALPVKELVDVPFASKAKGRHMGQEVDVMHACGHDAHTAILMATAEVLAGMKDQLPGSVKFIFQPAEEGPSEAGHGEHTAIGARAMIDAGVLDKPKVDAIFGLHMIPFLPVGAIGYRSGAILASGDSFSIKVNGRQTHGGFPWNGIDPVVSASQIVLGLQTIVSRQLNIAREPAVISIGSIHGGNRDNIVPDRVEMLGTLRAFDDAMRDEARRRMRTTAEAIAAASGATAELTFLQPSYSTTVNDAALTDRMLPTMQQVTGGKAVLAPKLGAYEDFSEYQKQVPGVFFFLGSTDPKRDLKTAPPNHSPRFEIDEASLAVGVRAMSALALDYLATP